MIATLKLARAWVILVEADDATAHALWQRPEVTSVVPAADGWYRDTDSVSGYEVHNGQVIRPTP